MKALFINGSPRKNGNTAQLLKRAMDGAREAGGGRRAGARPTIAATRQQRFVLLWNEWNSPQSTTLTTPNPSC